MGKKTKIGKQRLDKYYRLAKEAGYRSRAAFKLMQLNRRFEFLPQSRALVDLCAAPGGWLQVATQNMPVSSLCIGIDLVPIKPLANVITLQGDITEEKSRQMIKKELHGWEADCVLHDGAPNVGMNWLYDAFQQNQLTLSALRLASQILKKNGWFITKIFRSKDSQALIRTFEQLFHKVHVWKPAASRLESAEIFVVCEKYKKPMKIDKNLLDSRVVFGEENDLVGAEMAKDNPQEMLVTRKKAKKVRPLGYEQGDASVFLELTASQFIEATKDYIELLSKATKVILDDPESQNSPHTTEEVRQCLADIKVCGPREVREILSWRRKIRADLEKEKKINDGNEEAGEKVPEQTLEEKEDAELADMDRRIAVAKTEEKSLLKRKKRKMLKEKAREREKKRLKMQIDGDVGHIPDQPDLFSLKNIKKASHLATITEASVPDKTEDDQEAEDNDEAMDNSRDSATNINNEYDFLENDDAENPLLISGREHMTDEERRQYVTDQWFARDDFANMLDEDDETADLDAVEKYLQRVKKNDVVKDKSSSKRSKVEDEEKPAEANSSSAFDMQSDSSGDDEFEDKTAAKRTEQMKTRSKDGNSSMEVVPRTAAAPKAKRRKIDPELLALGEQMIYSSKSRRDLEDDAWNRYTSNDEGLPDWFVQDEKKHFRKQLPITRAQVAEYRERLRELNARPIKKVAQAKLRKQKRHLARIERAKKQAEKLTDNPEMGPLEKAREMKKIYKKAKSVKKDVSYQVVTKGKQGRMARPKGRYKVVDKRLKKDNRKEKDERRRTDKNKKKNKASATAQRQQRKSSRQKRAANRAARRSGRRVKRGKPV